MADSRIAELVKFLMGHDPNPALGGISPHPVPARAVMPYVTIREILAKELESLNGRSGLVRTIEQVECWDSDYERAHQLREFIKDRLLQFSGPIDTRTVDGPINHVMDVELYDGTRELHQLASRFQVWWTELTLPDQSGLPLVQFPVMLDYILFPVYDIYITNSFGYVIIPGSVSFPVYDVYVANSYVLGPVSFPVYDVYPYPISDWII